MIECEGPYVDFSFALEWKNVQRAGDKDLCVIMQISRMPAASKLKHLFISERDLSFYRKLQGELVTRLPNSQYLSSMTEIEAMDKRTVKHEMPDGSTHYIREGWYHGCSVKKGYCGSVLIAHQPQLQGKLLGIHIAGWKDIDGGCVTLVTREMFDEMNIKPSLNNMETQFMEITTEKDPNFRVPDGYITVGQIKPSLTVRLPDKTEIRKTILFDKVEKHVTEPAVLSPRDPRWILDESPMENGLLKYTKRTKPFPPQLREVVKSKMNAIHEEKLKPLVDDVGKISEDDIINGVPFQILDKVRPIDLTTSPGWPYIKDRPAGSVGKKFLFEEIGQRTTVS